jgi:hypothetical protein
MISCGDLRAQLLERVGDVAFLVERRNDNGNRQACPDQGTGLDVCELLPEHARLADKYTLLRSLAHDQADHGFGTRRFLTGYADDMPGSNNGPSYYPSLECGVNRALGVSRDGLPVAVNVGGFAGSPWRGPGFWGQGYQVPLVYSHNVGNGGLPFTTLNMPAGQFDERHQLLGQLERCRAGLNKSGALDAMDDFQRRAYEIIRSGRVSKVSIYRRKISRPASATARVGPRNCCWPDA